MTPQFAALQKQVVDLNALHRYAESEALIRPLVATGTAPLAVWRLLVPVLRRQGRIAETRRIQEMLVQSEPGNLSSRFELAETLLLQGEFTRGWREYRYRYSMPHTARIERKVQKPRWDGQPIRGKTLLIHDEQGFGDTFQFLRMVPWARERSGARVVLQINAEQLPFAQRAGGFDEILPRGALPPPFDFHCEMMSLPMAMNLQLSDLPGKMPYLTADPERVEHWRRRLAALPGPRVALFWSGRPTHFNDAARSMSLEDLAPLALPGVTFLSLQKGDKAAQAQRPPPGMNLLPIADETKDFADTAAVLSLVDLLISVDSSPAHLAGALGVPVWVMLSFVHDWRWLLHRTDSPWYPSARLFRQQSPYDWQGVMAAMTRELSKLKSG
jgi:Glycosyltransferase family 9 (heptosyltransferase)